MVRIAERELHHLGEVALGLDRVVEERGLHVEFARAQRRRKENEALVRSGRDPFLKEVGRVFVVSRTRLGEQTKDDDYR